MPECSIFGQDITSGCTAPEVSISRNVVRGGDEIDLTVTVRSHLNEQCNNWGCFFHSFACSYADKATEGANEEDWGGSLFGTGPVYGPSPPAFRGFNFDRGGAVVPNGCGSGGDAGTEEYTVTFRIDDTAPTSCFTSSTGDGPYCGVTGGSGGGGWWTIRAFNILGGACGPDGLERQRNKKCPEIAANIFGRAKLSFSPCNGITLTYNSSKAGMTSSAGMIGGWTLGLLQALLTEDSGTGDVNVDSDDGVPDDWTHSGGNYTPAHCDNYDQLVKNMDDTFTITNKDFTELNFDTDGLLSDVVDRNGNTTTVTRDSGNNDRITSIDDGRGRTVHFDYDSRTDNQPRYLRLNNATTGRESELEYDTSSRLSSITNAEGETVSFTYDGSGRLWKVTDPRGEVALELTYYNSGDYQDFVYVEKIYDQESRTYSYSGGDALTTTIVSTDLATSPTPPTRTTVYETDIRGMVVRMTDPVGNEHQYQYLDVNSPYLVSRYIDPNNNVTAYIYDDDGNVTKIVTGTDVQMTMDGEETDIEYETTGKKKHRVKKVKRPEIDVGGTPTRYETNFAYDTDGNLITITDATSEDIDIEYFVTAGLEGEVKSVTDRNGNKTEFTYYVWNSSSPDPDSRNGGNLKEVKSPSGPGAAPQRITTFRYDDYDNVLEVEDHGGNVWTAEFDDADRPTKLTDASNKYANLSYLNGLLEYIEAPANNGSSSNRRKTEFTFDDSGRMTKSESYISASTKEMRVRYEYDGFSNLTKLVRLMGGSETDGTLYEHDKLDRVTKVTDPLSRVTTITPQPFCSGMTSTSARGVERSVSFDHLCRMTEFFVGSDPDDPDSSKVEVEYDALGRVMKVTQTEVSRYEGSGSPPPREKPRFGSARYSKAGPTFPTEERTFEYDALDRLTKVTLPNDDTILYEYDKEGNLTKLTDPEGKVTEFTYFNDYRLREVKVVRPSVSDRVFTYSYDTTGRLEKIVYPDDTKGSGGTAPIEARFYGTAGASTEPGWDDNGNLLRLFYHRNGSRIHSFEYSYDDSGNRVSFVDTPANTANKVTWEYQYDWLDRLVEVKRGVGVSTPASQRTYVYDESDNRTFMDDHLASTSFRYLYNDGDEITKRQSSSTFQSRTAGDYSDAETFQHDNDGNMIARTVDPGGQNEATTLYFWDDRDKLMAIETPSGKVVNTYDPGGQRKLRVGDDGVKLESFYSGLPTLSETSSEGDSFSWIMAHGLAGFEKNGDLFYFIGDGLSSARVLVDAEGVEVAAYEFDEFGNRIAKTGTGSSPKTFVGGLGVIDETEDTGLHLMSQRWMDPTLGRFLNRDPIGYAGGLNLFSYVGNNPVNHVDPSGLISPGLDSWNTQRHFDGSVNNGGDATVLHNVNLAVVGTLNEPADYALMAYDIRTNGLHWSHGIAALPLIPFAAVKGLRKPSSEVLSSLGSKSDCRKATQQNLDHFEREMALHGVHVEFKADKKINRFHEAEIKVAGPDSVIKATVYLRDNVSLLALIEEFLHIKQLSRLSWPQVTGALRRNLEIQAHEVMLAAYRTGQMFLTPAELRALGINQTTHLGPR